MTLTPLDLAQQTFRRSRFGGLDEKDVRAFLEQAAAALEELTRKTHLQDEELRRREQRIAEFREREQLLQQTLTTAQRLAEEMKSHSRKEAELLLADAELQAEKIVANAQARRLQLVGEIDELKRARAAFTQQLASLADEVRNVVDGARGTSSGPQSEPPPVARTNDNLSFLAAGKRHEQK